MAFWCRVWNDGSTQLILLSPRARQLGASSAAAQRSVDLVRMPSSKLVSCGSLQPWPLGELPQRPVWSSVDGADEEY